jgi:membrane-associated phospholipid phosphatase
MKQSMSACLMIAGACFALSVGLIVMYHQGSFTHLDRLGFELALGVRTPLLTEWMKIVTQLGGGAVLAPLGVMLVAVCFLKGYRIEAAVIASTLLGSELLSEWLKMEFARPRPVGLNLIELPDSYAFPSGHALVGLAFYGIIATIVRERMAGKPFAAWIGPISAVLVALICASRVYLGVHYLSDVITGMSLSAVWYCLMLCFYRVSIARWRDQPAGPITPVR